MKLTEPFFYKGEWVQIDWTSQGIAGMNLLVDLTCHDGRAIENYRDAIERRNRKPMTKAELLERFPHLAQVLPQKER